MASDPSFPVIPGSASSGLPGPPPLELPTYSGEESTLASPGPSVEVGTLTSTSKLQGSEKPGTAQRTDKVAGIYTGTEIVSATVEVADSTSVAPVEILPKGFNVAVAGPKRQANGNLTVGTLSAVAEAGHAREEGTPGPEDEIGRELTRRLPLGLNRYVLAALFAIVVLLKGCTYWGWNGFQDMFYKNGAYLWECQPGVAGYGQRMHVGGVDYEDCAPRKNSINNMYTVIFCTHFISSAFSGWVLDAAGPKICMLAAILVEIGGWLLFAFSSQAFCAYYAGAVFLGIAADPAYLPLLSVRALFPGNESFIMSIMGSFRSISFAVPVILSKIYLSPTIPADSLWIILLGYVGLGLGFCLIVTFLLVPNEAFQALSEEAKERRKAVRAAQEAAKGQKRDAGCAKQTPAMESIITGDVAVSSARNHSTEGKELLQTQKLLLTQGNDDATSICKRNLEEASACSSSLDRDVEVAQMTFLSCLKTPEFLLILPCFVIALLRTEFYSKSNKEQLVVSTTGKDLYQMFSVVNILSFIPGPMMGKLADAFGIVFVLVLLNTCGIFVYVFLMPDELICKAISIIFYFFYCSFVLSNLYCYVAVNFPQKFFGKLTGFASLIGGVFSLTSMGWYKLSSETLFSWYPRNYLLVDGVMVLLGVINCFIIYGMYAAQRRKEALLRREEQEVKNEAAAALC